MTSAAGQHFRARAGVMSREIADRRRDQIKRRPAAWRLDDGAGERIDGAAGVAVLLFLAMPAL